MRKKISSRSRVKVLMIILATLMLSSVNLISTSAEICMDCGCNSGGPYYCPIPEVTVNGITCRASGCRLAPNYPATYVCNYLKVGTGTRDGCPPLEMCER